MSEDDNKPKSAISRGNLLVLTARKNVDAICAYLTRRLGNYDDAQDVCQSAFVELVATSDDKGGVDNPFGYFSTVLNRELAKFGRARAKECGYMVSSSEVELDEIAVRGDGGGDPSEELDKLQQFKAARAELAPKRAMVLGLVMQAGLSYEEVAQRMGITPDAVRRTLQRARKQLERRRLADKER